MFVDFNFGGFDDLPLWTFEISDGVNTRKQQIQANSGMAQMQFMQFMREAANAQQPLRVKVSQDEEVWNQYSKTLKTVENSIQFSNKAYVNKYKEEYKNE